MGEIVELDASEASVESVIKRLGYNQDNIESITAIVTWNDGTSDVYFDSHKTSVASYHMAVMQRDLLLNWFDES